MVFDAPGEKESKNPQGSKIEEKITLPLDLWELLILYVDVPSLSVILRLSKAINTRLMKTETVWRNLCHRHLEKCPVLGLEETRQLYGLDWYRFLKASWSLGLWVIHMTSPIQVQWFKEHKPYIKDILFEGSTSWIITSKPMPNCEFASYEYCLGYGISDYYNHRGNNTMTVRRELNDPFCTQFKAKALLQREFYGITNEAIEACLQILKTRLGNNMGITHITYTGNSLDSLPISYGNQVHMPYQALLQAMQMLEDHLTFRTINYSYDLLTLNIKYCITLKPLYLVKKNLIRMKNDSGAPVGQDNELLFECNSEENDYEKAIDLTLKLDSRVDGLDRARRLVIKSAEYAGREVTFYKRTVKRQPNDPTTRVHPF